jgi:hypothetical protein
VRREISAAPSCRLPTVPWSKANKKSWRDDAYMLPMLKEYFEGKLCERFGSVEFQKKMSKDWPVGQNSRQVPAAVSR